MLNTYNAGKVDEAFFSQLYGKDGAAKLGRILIEECNHLNIFVGKAINETYQAAALPFDLSIRQRLIEQLVNECKKMGKTVTVKYY